jgi:hypothetical protein
MSTITQEQEEKIASFIKDHTLACGLGTEASACSIAAINLALYSKLTDEIPDCMSDVIGRWIIGVQDEISSEMRNSEQWKNLLPFAAGTSRDEAKEEKRSKIVIDFVWELLKQLQPIADEKGFGDDWLSLTTDRQNDLSLKLYYSVEEHSVCFQVYVLKYINYITSHSHCIASQCYYALRIIRAVKIALPKGFTFDWELLDPCGTLHALIAA